MSHILAIDQGTSGTKALVVNDAGHVLGSHEVSVRPVYGLEGSVEQDPAELLTSVIEAGRGAIEQAGVEVHGLALANQGETVLAWDPSTGDPLTPMLVWQDRRAASVCEDLRHAAPLISRRTGLVLDSYFSAPKQAWIRQHLTRDGVVTTSDSWLIHHLTGEFVTDAATASRSLALDLDSGLWDWELLGLFGLQDEPLPAIVDSDAVIGTTTAFGRPVTVGGLIVDQQAALLAERCLQPGEAKCTFGTGAFLLANVGDAPTRSTAGLAASIAWQRSGERTYCLDGQVYTAASAVRWLQDLGLIAAPSDLDHVASPDAGDVLSVPAFAGLAAPWWDAAARGTFSGIGLSTGRGELVLAVLQGIAAQVTEIVRAAATDTGQPPSRLRVDGGLTRSHRLMQAVADQLQVQVDIYPSPHATALGAATLGRLALDTSLSLDDAVGYWEPSRSFTPQWSASRSEEFHQRWSLAAAHARATAQEGKH